MLVLNQTLSDYQEKLLTARGVSFERVHEDAVTAALKPDPAVKPDPTLVFDETLYFSREFLDEFLSRSRQSGATTTQACLKDGLFSNQLAILQEAHSREGFTAFPLFYTSTGTLDRSAATPITIDVDEYSESGNFPPHMLGKDNFKFSVTTRPILGVSESIHIGLVNMAANFARIGRLRRPGPLAAIRTLIALATAFTLDRTALKARALRALSHIDPTAEVHPTAVVEGSVIGPRAKIGAYAVIRFSVVGTGAFVDDHAGIKFSTIGEGAYIANNNVIFFTTVYPGAFLISGPYHFCCFGRNTAIMNSIPADYRLDGKTVRVVTSRGVRDTGLRFTGSIVGHETRIAAGLIFPPGRTIPGGLTLYPDPARVLNELEPDIAERGSVWFLKDGRLSDGG